MINKLYFAICNDRGQKLVSDIINDLLTYVKMHFTIEENFLRKSGYLVSLQHNREHERFV